MISIEDSMKCHKIWHKFSKFAEDKFGGIKNIGGYENTTKLEKYCKKHLPEIEIVPCDDEMHAGSTLFLVPHPAHGITIVYAPQLSSIDNQFFLYGNHYKKLIEKLNKLEYVYKDNLI